MTEENKPISILSLDSHICVSFFTGVFYDGREQAYLYTVSRLTYVFHSLQVYFMTEENKPISILSLDSHMCFILYRCIL